MYGLPVLPVVSLRLLNAVAVGLTLCDTVFMTVGYVQGGQNLDHFY